MEQFEIAFEAGVEYNEKLYISALDMNGLFEYDLKDKKARYICKFEEERTTHLHRCVILLNNEAWFIPKFGEYIAVVNLDTFTIEYIQTVYKEQKFKEVSLKYYSAGGINERYIFLCPTAVDTLLIIDSYTRKTYDYYLKREDDEDEGFAYGYYYEDKIVLWSIYGERSVEVDLRNGSIIKKIKHQKNEFIGVYFDKKEQKVWYSPGSASYIRCEDLLLGDKKEIVVKRDCENNILLMNWIVPYNNCLFFLGCMKDVIMCLYKGSDRLVYYRYGEENDGLKYMPIVSQKYVILKEMDREGGVFWVFDEEKDCFDSYSLKIGKGELVEQIRELRLNVQQVFGKIIYEKRDFDMKLFLEVCK